MDQLDQSRLRLAESVRAIRDGEQLLRAPLRLTLTIGPAFDGRYQDAIFSRVPDAQAIAAACLWKEPETVTRESRCALLISALFSHSERTVRSDRHGTSLPTAHRRIARLHFRSWERDGIAGRPNELARQAFQKLCQLHRRYRRRRGGESMRRPGVLAEGNAGGARSHPPLDSSYDEGRPGPAACRLSKCSALAACLSILSAPSPRNLRRVEDRSQQQHPAVMRCFDELLPLEVPSLIRHQHLLAHRLSTPHAGHLFYRLSVLQPPLSTSCGI
jgi:hypothetical protein